MLQPVKLPLKPPRPPHLMHQPDGGGGKGLPHPPPPNGNAQARSSQLTGPTQLGALMSIGASHPPEAPSIPTVGLLVATSSHSAFNTLAPIEGEKEDAHLLKALSLEDKILINQKLDNLREASDGILSGVTNFYNQAELIPADSQDTPEALADASPLNAAFRLLLIALDTGFPCPDMEVKTPLVFEGFTWTHAAGLSLLQ